MSVLVDTNILLRLVQPYDAASKIAKNAVDSLRQAEEPLYVAVQNIIEFWAVSTRPVTANGVGFTPERALREIDGFKQLFQVLSESNLILAEWERLVAKYRVSGKNAHDARLVAAMEVNRIDKILTFDTADFTRFSHIRVLDPRSFQ